MPKRRIIALVTFVAGAYYILEWIIPIRGPRSVGAYLTEWQTPIGQFLQVVSAFAIGMGWFQLMKLQGRNLARGTWDARLNAVAFYVSFFLVLAVGLAAELRPEPAAPDTLQRLWNLLVNDLVITLQAAVFSLLAFFIVTAAYRAFRVRTVEAGLLMAAAFIVMLGQVPIGGLLLSWLPGGSAILPTMSAWILMVITSASLRAIGFGVFVGAIAMSLRIWLSLERGAYFEAEV